MKIIQRERYLQELRSVLNTPDIKVITGIRRSGKSILLEELLDVIRSEVQNANVIHINYNLTDYEHLQEYHALEAYVEAAWLDGSENYVLIDEIQMCEHFEKAINSLHARSKYNILLTGSNAFLQSSDLATLFVGRCYEMHIYPFSFHEYLIYFPSENLYGSLTRYIREGGMAGSYLYADERQRFRYLNQEVLGALIVRDVIKKYRIKNPALFERLIDFLMDSIGSTISVRTIANTLGSAGAPVEHKTISRYLDHLCGAFAFYRVRRYDIRGKRYLRSEDKYYLADPGFRYARLGTKNMDYGHMLENIVALELMRRGYEIYVGVLYGKEIDFVAISPNSKIYIQVANDISESATFEREIRPLMQIKDAYSRMLIARTYQPPYEHDGVQIIDAAEWLAGNARAKIQI